MEQNQALKVLIQAVNVAQKRGAYNLNEASTIAAATSVFVASPVVVEETEAPAEEAPNNKQGE